MIPDNQPEAKTLVLEREFAHPAAKIWRALTEGPLIKEWLMDNDFQPVIGHGFKFRATPMPQWDGIVESEVLAVDPPHALSYRWNALGLESVVRWTLLPTAGGALLRMEQSGFKPDQEHAFKGANYGWQNFLGKLERLVAELK